MWSVKNGVISYKLAFYNHVKQLVRVWPKDSMQSFDRDIESLIFPGNKATDQNKCDNCEEYEHLNQLLRERLWSDLYLEIMHVKNDHVSTSEKLCSVMFFAHLFAPFQAIVPVFKIALFQIWPNLNHTNKTPVNLYVAKLKQPFPNNCTGLMLHIIPNRKLHTNSFQMEYNMAVCTVGPLNSTKIGFCRSTVVCL